MSELSPRYYALKERFEQYKADPDKLPDPDRVPDGWWLCGEPGMELACIKHEIEREIRDWRQVEPQTTESKNNLDAFESLESDIKAWEKLELQDEWGRYLTGRKLVSSGFSIPELVQTMSSSKREGAYLRAWNPVDGFQVADMSKLSKEFDDPEYSASLYDFSFTAPQDTEEKAQWEATLLGFVFDLDEILHFLPEGGQVPEEVLKTPYTSLDAALETARRELKEDVGGIPSPAEMRVMRERDAVGCSAANLGEKYYHLVSGHDPGATHETKRVWAQNYMTEKKGKKKK